MCVCVVCAELCAALLDIMCCMWRVVCVWVGVRVVAVAVAVVAVVAVVSRSGGNP